MNSPEGHQDQVPIAAATTDYDHLLQEARGETEAEPYTAEEARKLMWGSFQFSQGDTELQANILDYVAARYGERFTPGALQASSEVMHRLAPKFIHASGIHYVHINDEDIHHEIDEVYKGLNEQLNQPGVEPAFDLVPRIAELAIERDYRNLVTSPHGRPDRVRGAGQTGPGASYLSQIMLYGCEGSSTGTAEYDHLFADVAVALPEIWDKNWEEGVESPGSNELSVGSALRRVAGVYWQHYPEARQRLKPELAHLFEGV